MAFKIKGRQDSSLAASSLLDMHAQHMMEDNTTEVVATYHKAESINLLASCRSLEGAYTGSKSAGKHGMQTQTIAVPGSTHRKTDHCFSIVLVSCSLRTVRMLNRQYR